ncbi:monocarboxylate transporter 10-like isoform X4 [Ostrea edulis]|uniref:monocarboxylate transporter 10-like isoform X4 n=1 Tax=Ostrea edulis TaxID=37623 RepID=UPI0024AED36C|nr:monocarboxylate transporter 10-like isoform X4 [Ostrea edulis]
MSKLNEKGDEFSITAVKSSSEAHGARVPTPGNAVLTEEFVPPDGGWGWVVCIASLLTNGIVFSILNTFGIIYVYLVKEYATDNPTISFKTSWVGSVCTGVTFLMSISASICSDRIGIRPTAFFGAALGVIGLISSAFVTRLELLYLTYGLFLGIGGGFIYSLSLVILGHYFKKHLGIVNGIVTFGSSLSTIILSIVLPIVLDSLGIKYVFLILGGLYCLLLLCSLTWKPLFHGDTNFPVSSTEINMEDAVKHTQDRFPDANAFILITCMQSTSGLGRIIFGEMADLECVNRIYMQQTAFVVMGVVTACIPFSASFKGLIAISLILGICDGIVVCLLGPIVVDLVGLKNTSHGIGFILGGISLPITVGPPIAVMLNRNIAMCKKGQYLSHELIPTGDAYPSEATDPTTDISKGLLYDRLHTYEIAFVAAGVAPVVGAIMMCLIPRVKQ